MKCIICNLSAVDRGGDDEDEEIPLNLVLYRKQLLSIFCKYFNWENDYNLTPSQLLSWFPSSSSSSSAASNFPFCSKCEDKMNELNDLHDSLAKIQLSISTLISSMSMEIIKVVESSSFSSSSPCQTENHYPDTKATASKKSSSKQSPIATTTIVHENKGARSSRRLQAKENEIQILDIQSQDYDDDGGSTFKTTKNKSKSLSKSSSKIREPESVNEFRKNVYKRFKPDVIVQDCNETENLKINSPTTTATTTTTTTTISSSALQTSEKSRRGRPTKLKALEKLAQLKAERKEAARRREERKQQKLEKQMLMNLIVTPNVSNNLNTNAEECDTITIKNEPTTPARAHSPDHDDTFDDHYADDNDNGAEFAAGNEDETGGYTSTEEDQYQNSSNAMDTSSGHQEDGEEEDEEMQVDSHEERPRRLTKEEKEDEEYAQKFYWTVRLMKGYKKQYARAPKEKLIEVLREMRAARRAPPPPHPPRRFPRSNMKPEPEPESEPEQVEEKAEEPSEEEQSEESDSSSSEEEYGANDSDFDPNPNKPEEKKVSTSHFAKETEPGSNIFRYYNWEFAKISETSWKCLTCHTVREGTRSNMMRHINKHHNDLRPRCQTCGNSWTTQKLKDQHICKPLAGPRPKPFQELSPGQFLYMDRFLYQKVDRHSNAKGYEYECLNDNCGKLTREQNGMHQHIKQCHEGSVSSFTCEICFRTTTSESVLKKHMATHSDAKNEICEICGKSYKTPSSLLTHHRSVHQGPFICDFEGCGKEYLGPRGLRNHRARENHPDKKKYEYHECPNCGKKLLGERSLARHLTSLKCVIQKINCHFCAKELAPGSLKSHLNKHCTQNPDYPERMVSEENSTQSHNAEGEEGGAEQEEEQPPPPQPEVVIEVETNVGQESEPQAYDNTANDNVNYYSSDLYP